MSLSPGAPLDPYEVATSLGAGGPASASAGRSKREPRVLGVLNWAQGLR